MNLELIETSGPLPTSYYELRDGENVVGKLQLRHKPSKSDIFPERFESHIYYEIYPEYRGRGYGTKILALGLDEARKIGLENVILTCLESNTPSRKIIESNGGEIVDKQTNSEEETVLKFNINL